jgi:hypothetical protein
MQQKRIVPIATVQASTAVAILDLPRLSDPARIFIMTARLNHTDPCAWLADEIVRIASIPRNRLYERQP